LLGRHGAAEPFALGFSGNFWAARPGVYRFALQADDGAVLSIDGQQIVDDDQRHDTDAPGVKRYGSLKLCSGAHALELRYLHSSQTRARLNFEMAPPGEELQPFRYQNFSPPLNAASAPVACLPREAEAVP
jgi:hypothetical protein